MYNVIIENWPDREVHEFSGSLAAAVVAVERFKNNPQATIYMQVLYIEPGYMTMTSRELYRLSPETHGIDTHGQVYTYAAPLPPLSSGHDDAIEAIAQGRLGYTDRFGRAY